MIHNNLIFIQDQIKKSCKIYQKNPKEVNLIAVSKTINEEKIIEAIQSGCQDFGENYIKEVKEKWPKIKEKFPQAKLHFIGHLQSNKAPDAVRLFDYIHTLDSEKLAISLKKEIIKQSKNPEIFIQVNIGQEPQKSGINPQDLDDFIKFARQELALKITGLMCIPPANETASPYFALLNKFAKKNNLKNLSMGMSSDFQDAIALDANYIRIGTKIFGKRCRNIF